MNTKAQFIKMPSIDWNKLNFPDPFVAWSILAQEISDKFFSRTLIAVPAIDHAEYYDLMVCFAKIVHFWQWTPTFRLLGHFLDISAPTKNEMELMEFINPLKEDLNSTSYSYTWTDDNKSKTVTIKMSGLSKYELNWNLNQGSLVIDCEKVDLSNGSVYIISEVVYAQKVTIDVQVEKKERSERKLMEVDVQIPVAFSYLKFPVDKNGVLLAAKDTKVKLDAVFEK